MGTKLNYRQVAAARALGRGLTRSQAAERADVHERTIYKYLNDPTFRQFVEDCRHQHLQGALGAMASGSRSAAVFLHAVVAGEFDHTDPKILNSRIRAATSLLSSSVNLTKYEEIQQMRRETLTKDEMRELIGHVFNVVENNVNDKEILSNIGDELREVQLSSRWYY